MVGPPSTRSTTKGPALLRSHASRLGLGVLFVAFLPIVIAAQANHSSTTRDDPVAPVALSTEADGKSLGSRYRANGPESQSNTFAWCAGPRPLVPRDASSQDRPNVQSC